MPQGQLAGICEKSKPCVFWLTVTFQCYSALLIFVSTGETICISDIMDRLIQLCESDDIIHTLIGLVSFLSINLHAVMEK